MEFKINIDNKAIKNEILENMKYLVKTEEYKDIIGKAILSEFKELTKKERCEIVKDAVVKYLEKYQVRDVLMKLKFDGKF